MGDFCKHSTFLVLLLLLSTCCFVAFAEEPVSSPAVAQVVPAGQEAPKILENYSEEFSPEKLKTKKYKFRIYKVLGGKFTYFCQLLEVDGRRALFYELFSSDLSKVPDCPACKPFISALKKGCAPKKVRKRKKIIRTKDENGKVIKTVQPEEPVVLPKKQREPSIRVISYAADLFTMLANDKTTGDLTYQAFLEIEKLVKNKSAQTFAEQDYIKALWPYIKAVFSDYALAEKQRKEEKRRREAEETKWRFGKKS